jgi:hypothetical protein
MLPQKPPQPSCSYFPLKALPVGIQTSKLMMESLVGVDVPATRSGVTLTSPRNGQSRATISTMTSAIAPPARRSWRSACACCARQRNTVANRVDAGDRHAILVIDIRIIRMFDPNGRVPIGKIRCLEHLHRRGDGAIDFSQQPLKLGARRLVSERAARQPGPLDRALAFFDPLLAGATVVIEADDALGRPPKPCPWWPKDQ